MPSNFDPTQTTPRRTDPNPVFDKRLANADPQGFLGDFADAFILDSSLGQLGQWIGTKLAAEHYEREQRNRGDKITEDADFNALRDMGDELRHLPMNVLEDIYDAHSMGDVRRILYNHQLNTERRARIENHTGTRILAGFLDPVNLVPIPLALGKGVFTGMKAALPITAGTMASTESLRHALDPSSTIEETAFNIGAGTLFGEVIAGGAGAYKPGITRSLGKTMKDSRAGQAIKSGYGKIPRWAGPDLLERSGSKMQQAFDRMESINRWINQPIGDITPARTIRARHMSEAEFNSNIKDTLDQEVTYEDWLSGEAPDSLGPGIDRYQGVEGERYVIIDRRNPLPESLVNIPGPDIPKGSHDLYAMRQGRWEFVSTGSRKELAGQVDPFATRQVRSFNTPEAYILGDMKFGDMYPDAPSRVDDPATYKAWQDSRGKEVQRDPDGLHVTEATETEIYSRIAKDLDVEFNARQKALDSIGEEMQAVKAEIKAIKAKLRKTKDKRWKTRRKKELAGKEATLGELQSQEFIAQNRLDATKQNLIDSETSPDPEDWDIRPTLTGLEQAFGSTGQMPWYRLVKTKLRTEAPELAGDWQRTAYELAGSPGLASYGHEAGKGAGASVESMSRTWLGKYTRVKSEVDRIYYEEYAKIGESPTPGAIWYLQRKQRAGKGWESMKRKFKVGEPKAESDLMTLDQFRQEVGKAMMRSDTNITEPLIAKAAREYRKLVREFETEGRKYGVFRTQQVMERKLENNLRRIEDYENRIKDMRNPNTIAKWQGWIDDMEMENIELAEWIETSKHDTDKAWQGETGEHAWFHRVWNVRAVEDHADILKDVLRTHFKENPYVVTYGVRKKLSMDDASIEARVEETYASIRREAILGDSIHMMSHGRGSMLEHLNEYRAKMEERLAEMKAEAPGVPERETTIDINEVTEYDGIKVVEPESPRIHPEHGGKSPASIRRDKDGNAIEIHINRQAVAETFRNKQWANPRTKGIDALPEDAFPTVNHWLEFLLEHEAQHLVHPRIKAKAKGYAANENAINKAAMKKLGLGELKTPGKKGFDINVMQKRIELIDSRIKRFEKGGEGVAYAGVPSGLIGRKLDLPNERLIDIGRLDDMKGHPAEPGINFIHTNVEDVLFHYTQRVAPVIEMAKKYGDFRMKNRIQELHQRIDEKIESATPEEADRLAKERDELTQAIEDLRDKVLGTYGIPEDPSAISTRTIRLLMAWNTLTAMGRAFLTAINDIGMVVQVNGMRSMFGDLLDQFFNAQSKTKWKLAKEEVEWAGQALEVQNAIRSRAIMDLPGDPTAFNRLEQWTYDQQGNFFFLNLLSGWTDFAKRFSGSMIQSKLIKNSIEWSNGTISKVDKEEMAKAGVTEAMARNWVKEWEAAGAQRAKGDKGFYLANTMNWKDQAVVQEFRAVLSSSIDNIIITPMAADKPNFMSKDWGRMVMQYHGFSMAATHRIFMSNMQKRDKRALNTVMMMVGLSMIIDQIKRPDYIQLSPEDQLYRAVELSGTLGMITDLNTMLEGATGGEYGFRTLAGLKNMERYSDWGSKVGAVAGAVPNQWLGTVAALTDSDADADKVARTLRYLVPYNNWWLWNDMVTRTQRTFADIAED